MFLTLHSHCLTANVYLEKTSLPFLFKSCYKILAAGNMLATYRTFFADCIWGRKSYPFELKYFITTLNSESRLNLSFSSSDKEMKYCRSTENGRLAIN